MNEYRLSTLPASRDLTALQIRDWKAGRLYGPGDYVVIDGHPYVCDEVHEASADDRPSGSANWTGYWTRALWQASEYYITTGSDVVGYVTDESAAPVARLIRGSGDASVGALTASGTVTLSGLPTSDPGVAGQLWSDLGAVKVSAG